MKLATFEVFIKTGDVLTFRDGATDIVESVDIDPNEDKYPVHIWFESGLKRTFTLEGKYSWFKSQMARDIVAINGLTGEEANEG